MVNSLHKLFKHKWVLEVCVHIHPITIKIHPVFFINPYFKIPFLKSAVLQVLSEWLSSVQAPPIIVDWPVIHCVASGAVEDKNISD